MRYTFEQQVAALTTTLRVLQSGKSIIDEGIKIAEQIGVKPGAFTDRMRNFQWLITNGESGRNNDKFGVSWTEPLFNEFGKQFNRVITERKV